MGFSFDITEQRLAEQRLRDSEARLETELRHTSLLRDLAARLVTEESGQAIYDDVLDTAIAIMSADAGTVQVYDSETNSLVLFVSRGIPGGIADHFHQVDASSSTACGLALRTGQRTFVDFEQSPDDEACRLHVEAGFSSAMAAPLLSRDGSRLAC
ncbi:putative PAS/PAC sensor protein (fragment) [Bradyrhizobium sp. ORS 375]